MRIAHIIHGWPPESMGGTGMYVAAIANAHAESGHTTAIVAPESAGPTIQKETVNNVEHWVVGTEPIRRWTDTWNGSTDSWLSWCREWNPDVVHIHHLSGWSLRLIEVTPCRTVLTLHDYAIPCARGQLVRENLSLCDGPSPAECSDCLGPALRTHPALTKVAAMLQPFPLLTTLGRSLIQQGTSAADSRVIDRVAAANHAIESADVLLAPSNDLIERMVSLGYRRPQKTALPLLNQPRPPKPMTDGPVRFLFASSIIPTKGPQRLIKAFLNLGQHATLTIAGHAPKFDGHPSFAANLRHTTEGCPNIQWIGAVPSDQIPELMSNHDVLVLPSIWPENSPLVVREATAAGLHVIASAIGGTHELAATCTLFHTDVDLQHALEEAIQVGRMRHARAKWPTPAEHAQTLVTGTYLQGRA